MVHEPIQRYRGVICIHCRKPIALPAGVAKRVAETKSSDGIHNGENGPRVFTLRCKSCLGEGLYSEAKFVDCEGVPQVRHGARQGASPMMGAPGRMTRAANG